VISWAREKREEERGKRKEKREKGMREIEKAGCKANMGGLCAATRELAIGGLSQMRLIITDSVQNASPFSTEVSVLGM
jgi:hypothetical protein